MKESWKKPEAWHCEKPEEALVKMQLQLQWRLQDIGTARIMGQSPRTVTVVERIQPEPVR